ncbi:permease-like cell division protein FtsX [Plantactinospora sp. BC1]|uniref:permease-like cell division protein FtsX n=1 Tax=Plantactinospora sp. BC1 TaxID=2108470 RepID=UPI00131F0AB4|nr:permease-like cell division protein FtsX [Plantactinospora sp. BC1]
MRRAVTTLVLTILLTSGLVGCRPDPVERINPPITVFLTADVTPEQKQAVQERLRDVPDAAEVTFQSREQAYADIKERLAEDPELLDAVRADKLPESFKLTLRDRDAFDRAVAGPLVAELRALPGVDDVVYFKGESALTPPPSAPAVANCAWGSLSPAPKQGDWREIWVYLSRTISESERQAVEAKLRALPDVVAVRLKPRDDTDGTATAAPERAEAATPTLPPRGNDLYQVELADQAAANRAAASELDTELCRLPGVARVVLPPKRDG